MGLLVEVITEGFRRVVAEIGVRGADSVSTAEIIERSGLAIDQHPSRRSRASAVAALMDTGQFLAVRVDEEELGVPERMRATIHVTEAAWARPLATPQTEVEEKLEGLRRRLTGRERWDQDLVISVGLDEDSPGMPFRLNGTLRGCMSPDGKTVWHVKVPASRRRPGRLEGYLLCEGGAVRWVSTAAGSVSESFTPTRWEVNVSMVPDLDDASRSGLVLQVAGGVVWPRTAAAGLRVDLPPFVTYKTSSEVEWRASDDEQSLIGEDDRVRLTLSREGSGFVLDVFGLASVYTDAGAYDRLRRDAMSAVEGARSGPTAPLALSHDLLAYYLQSEPARSVDPHVIAAVVEALNDRIAPLLDRTKRDEHGFTVRLPVAVPPAPELADMFSLVPIAVDAAFPEGSWPWTMCREAGFLLQGRGRHAMAELERLVADPRTGPLGHLTLSLVLRKTGSHVLAREVARQGMRTVAWERFLEEVRVICSEQELLGQFVLALGEAAKDLGPAEWDLLAEMPESAEAEAWVRSTGDWVEANRGKESWEFVEAYLEHYWRAEIGHRILTALYELAEQ